MYKNEECCSKHNGKKLDTTQMSLNSKSQINCGIVTQWNTNENERTTNTHNNMDHYHNEEARHKKMHAIYSIHSKLKKQVKLTFGVRS